MIAEAAPKKNLLLQFQKFSIKITHDGIYLWSIFK